MSLKNFSLKKRKSIKNTNQILFAIRDLKNYELLKLNTKHIAILSMICACEGINDYCWYSTLELSKICKMSISSFRAHLSFLIDQELILVHGKVRGARLGGRHTNHLSVNLQKILFHIVTANNIDLKQKNQTYPQTPTDSWTPNRLPPLIPGPLEVSNLVGTPPNNDSYSYIEEKTKELKLKKKDFQISSDKDSKENKFTFDYDKFINIQYVRYGRVLLPQPYRTEKNELMSDEEFNKLLLEIQTEMLK